jgi:DNA polymerase-3 subunit alpha
LAAEKELLGFYVSGHPLDKYSGHFDSVQITPISELAEMPVQAKPKSLELAGIVNTVQVRYSKKDNRAYGVIQLEDFSGLVELMVWSDDYEQYKALLVAGKVLKVRCRCLRDQRGDGNRISFSKAEELQPKPSRRRQRAEPEGDAAAKPPAPKTAPTQTAPRPLVLRLNCARHSGLDLQRIAEVLTRLPGTRPVVFEIADREGRRQRWQADPSFWVQPGIEPEQMLAFWM